MLKDIKAIIAELDAFQPEDDNDLRLYALLEGLQDLPEHRSAMDAMFALMERFPDANLGSPGPLVHELEAMGGFEALLRASSKRMPSDLTVWMVNRMLNVDDAGGPWREAWLSDLREVAARSDVPKSVRASAVNFVRHQADADREKI
jgi:hypothetical protein